MPAALPAVRMPCPQSPRPAPHSRGWAPPAAHAFHKAAGAADHEMGGLVPRPLRLQAGRLPRCHRPAARDHAVRPFVRYIVAQGVKSWTGPSPVILARISALGSPRSSPDTDPVAMLRAM